MVPLYEPESVYVPVVKKLPIVTPRVVPAEFSVGLELNAVVDASPTTIADAELPSAPFVLTAIGLSHSSVPPETVVVPVKVFGALSRKVPAEPVPVFTVNPAEPASVVK